MSQHNQAKSEYLRTKVLTASPEELHLMLIDGAIKFAEEAKQALADKHFETAHEATVRAQNIVLELSSGLDHEIAPDLCGKLSSLYNFIYRRLIEANLKHDPAATDDALRILNYQRETWVMLMQKLAEENRPPESAQASEAPDPTDPRPSLSLSV